MLWNEYLIDTVKRKNLSWQKLADKLGITYHELFCGLYQGWLLNTHAIALARLINADLQPYKRPLTVKSKTPIELVLLKRYQRQKGITSVTEDVFKAENKRAIEFENMFIERRRGNNG